MISNLKTLFKKKLASRGKKSSFNNSSEYWQARAKKFGKRAVISIDHSNDEFEKVKNRDQNILFPLLKERLTGREKLVLDFGCGSGRFTDDLAGLIKNKAVGVDPTEELIELAPKSDRVEYIVMKDETIPLPEESVDVIWIYAVLGCIKNGSMNLTFVNLHRVLRKGGLLFMVENTSSSPNSEFYTYRTHDEYMKFVYFAKMSHVSDYFDVGKDFKEKFSVMAGRKKS